MLQETSDFLPTKLEGWITIIGAIAGAATVTWAMVKDRIKQDVNGVGQRVKQLEAARSREVAVIDELKEGVRETRQHQQNLRETVGETRRSQEAISERLAEMQTRIIDEVQKTRDSVSREVTRLRERVVRLETITQLEQKLGSSLGEERRENDD